MTPTNNPDAGPVELLRERVREATAAHLDADPEARESEFYRLLVRLYDVIDTEPASPAAQAVARALLGAEGQTTTEWCVFLGDVDPNGDVARITTETQGQAEDALAMLLRTHASQRIGIARATVTRGPWRVVTAEGGEQG